MSRKGCASAFTVAATLSLFVSLPEVRAQLPPSRPPSAVTVFGVGDIMHCGSPNGAELTGRLMERLLNETPNSIGVTLGDNSNDDGSEESYDCLNRSTWGKLMDRLWPTPGNHDYDVDKDLPFYYLYFPKAGPTRLGYYAHDLGDWRVYALNSELALPELRQRQLDWLARDLQANHKTKCVLAYFHRPPFSSGKFASPARSLLLFKTLYRYGADLIATGHEHFFAFLPPLNPEGLADSAHGVPLLIAGTGGAVFFERPRTLRWGKNGEEILARTLGVLKLTLKPGAFEWAFVPAGQTAQLPPSGAGRCHDNPPGYVW